MLDIHLAKSGGKVIAVADIGSGSAGLTYLLLHRGAPAEVIAAERVVLSAEKRSKSASIAKLEEAVQETFKKISQKKVHSADELFCVIHSPWTRSISTGASSHFEKDTTVHDSMIGELAQKALAEKIELDRNNILEASVIRIELNGYPVGEPAGKSAHDIRITTLISDCDAELRAAVQTTLQKLFPQLVPVFRSSTRALLTVLRERTEDRGNHVIVDVGSEATNLVVLRDGVVSAQHLIPDGMRSMLERIAPSGMQEETLGLVRMLEQDECSTDACKSVQEAMARAEPELVRAFGEGMAACASVRKLPNSLLVVAHPDISPWLSRLLTRIDFTQFTQTTQPFVAQTLSLKELETFVRPNTGVPIDTGLAVSAALVNIEKSRA